MARSAWAMLLALTGAFALGVYMLTTTDTPTAYQILVSLATAAQA